jgi:hypothetical protein
MRIFEPILGEKAGGLRESLYLKAPWDADAIISGGRTHAYHSNCDTDHRRTDEIRRQDRHMYGMQNSAERSQKCVAALMKGS